MKEVYLFVLCLIHRCISGTELEITSNRGKCVRNGDLLEITCSFNQTTGSIKDLKIIHPRRRDLVPTRNTTTSITAVLRSVNISDTGTYRCSHGDTTADMVIVVKEDDPMPKNLTCMVFDEVMTCSWQHTDDCSNWTLYYTVDGNGTKNCCEPSRPESPSFSCANLKNFLDMSTVCKKPVPEVTTYCHPVLVGDEAYSFELVRRNPFGSQTMTKQIYSGEEITKLDQLLYVSYHATSDAVLIKWTFQMSSKVYDNGILCQAKSNEIMTSRLFSGDTDDKFVNMSVNDLHPFSNYNITVKCKINGSMFWGDPVTRLVRTHEDTPLVGPSTTSASYSSYRCGGNIDHFCTAVYIENLNKYDAQGVIIGYRANVSTINHDARQFDFSNLSTSLLFPSVDVRHQSYTITIWAETKKGLSRVPTVIQVDPSPGDFKIQEVIVEKDDLRYLVSAKVSPTPDDTVSYVFHWCYGLKTDTDVVDCKAGYGYVESILAEIWIKLDQNISAVAGAWHFGTSLRLTSGIVGISWEDCQFESYKTEPQKGFRPNSPTLKRQSETSLYVELDYQFCTKTDPRPVSYTILYRNMDNDDDTRVRVFEANVSNSSPFLIDKLKRDSNYSVQYFIEYRNGRSLPSFPVYIQTKGIHGNKPKETVDITLLWVVPVVFCIIVILIIILKFKAWYKKVDNTIDPVTIEKSSGGGDREMDTFSNYVGFANQETNDAECEVCITFEPDPSCHHSKYEMHNETCTVSDRTENANHSDEGMHFHIPYVKVDKVSSNCLDTTLDLEKPSAVEVRGDCGPVDTGTENTENGLRPNGPSSTSKIGLEELLKARVSDVLPELNSLPDIDLSVYSKNEMETSISQLSTNVQSSVNCISSLHGADQLQNVPIVSEIRPDSQRNKTPNINDLKCQGNILPVYKPKLEIIDKHYRNNEDAKSRDLHDSGLPNSPEVLQTNDMTSRMDPSEQTVAGALISNESNPDLPMLPGDKRTDRASVIKTAQKVEKEINTGEEVFQLKDKVTNENKNLYNTGKRPGSPVSSKGRFKQTSLRPPAAANKNSINLMPYSGLEEPNKIVVNDITIETDNINCESIECLDMDSTLFLDNVLPETFLLNSNTHFDDNLRHSDVTSPLLNTPDISSYPDAMFPPLDEDDNDTSLEYSQHETLPINRSRESKWSSVDGKFGYARPF